jgi:hypothetical protein
VCSCPEAPNRLFRHSAQLRLRTCPVATVHRAPSKRTIAQLRSSERSSPEARRSRAIAYWYFSLATYLGKLRPLLRSYWNDRPDWLS